MAASPASVLTTIGISMPADFPARDHEAIHEHCKPKMTPNPPLATHWSEYSAAWNAIAYRFRAVADHDEEFKAAITRQEHSDRYRQERELFNFFVSGLSTIETFAYGLYFLASATRPIEFPINKPRSITLTATARQFANTFPTCAITSRLAAVEKDSAFEEWRDIRNILAHRCSPGRILHLSVGGPPTNPNANDIWRLNNISLNSDTTGLRRQWLSQTLGGLLADARVFVEQEI